MNTGAIAEARPLSQNVAEVSDHRMRIRIIEGNVWGSSGYYSREVLERDGPTTFPAGTHMYLDHPGTAEEYDRPERTLRDLAGVLVSDAVYERDGLYADVRVYEQWAMVISEMAEDIGISIRATAEIEPGTISGQSGPVITKLLEGISVDFVTRAGAGGRIVQVLESARSKIREAVSDKAWSDFKSSDYSLAQWKRACLIKPSPATDSKSDYKLPVREPNGTLNRNGVHAAAGALAGARSSLKNVSADQKKAAAKRLVSMYKNQLKEDPPESLSKLAGTSESTEAAKPGEEGQQGSEGTSSGEGDNSSETNKTETEEATANNRRAQLNIALKREWGEVADVWCRDLDEEKRIVYFALYTHDSYRLMAQEFEPSADDKSASLVGEPYEVMTQTEYVPLPALPQPASSVGESSTGESAQESEDTNMGQTTIDEKELAQLRESSTAADSLRDELKESRTNERKAEVKAAKETIRANHEHARRIVSDELHEANVKAPALARALSLDPPLVAEGDNAGSVDEEKLKAAVKEAVGEIQLQVDESSGGVKGFGSSKDGDDEEVTEAELDKLSAGIFGRSSEKVNG